MTTQTHDFQAEVKTLLHLMIHSLYSHKEIFLRELISNASDANDKLRFLAVSHEAFTGLANDLKIELAVDEKARTLSISDNGIGMTLDEAGQHLGTIARSGTKEFLQSLTGEKAKDSQLIGQFGVGFYSAFMVADKVDVFTRKAGEAEGAHWSSLGDGTFTLEPCSKETHGTQVVLHLKEEESEFLSPWRIRDIVKRYSDHIGFPVLLKNDKDEWEIINQASALWTLPKSSLKEDDYVQFYQHLTHDFEKPLIYSHNTVEGRQSYTSLLYIPSKAPFDLYDRDKPRGLKLYVRRVFIMDHAEHFLPLFLRFVRGIIDAEDLPLNVSREMLQRDKAVDNLRAALTKRVLGLLEELAGQEDKYTIFWAAFGSVLKEGLVETPEHKDMLAKLLRFTTTQEAQESVTLQAYVERMKPGQKKIYFLTAPSMETALASPHLEQFKQRNIEVLLLTQPIDEWWVGYLTQFNEHPLQSVVHESAEALRDIANFEGKEDKPPIDETAWQGLTEKMQHILVGRVKAVRMSERLTESPACLTREANEQSLQMERILRAAGHALPPVLPTLEINPTHILIRGLQNETDESRIKPWAEVLLGEAMLLEGAPLHSPKAFTDSLNDLLLKTSITGV